MGAGDYLMGFRPVVAFALIAAAVLGLMDSAHGQDLAEVFEVDDSYSKTLPAGGEVTYVWLVYNRNASDLVVTTSVEPASGLAWEASVQPRYAILRPGEGLNLSLAVTATEALEDGTLTFEVTVSLALASEPTAIQRETVTALTTLEAAPPVLPKENKILGLFDNTLPSPLNNRWVTFLLSIAIWIGFAVVALGIISPVLRNYAKRTQTSLDDVVLGIIRGPLVVILITYGVVQSLAVLQPPAEMISLLFTLYSATLVLMLTWLAYRIFRGVVIEYGKRVAAKKDTPIFDILWPVINRAGAILIVVIGASSIAALFGMDLTAFIAGMGVLGIAIAFAAQESLSNFFSGVFLLLDRPFKEGDLVEIDGDRCRIERIGLRTTRLYHRPSHKILVVPNNKMARDMIVNLVEPDEAIRQRTTVGVAYGSDVDEVKATLVAAAKNHPLIIKDEPGREPYARLEEFGDSAMKFKLKFWVSDADKLNRVRGEVNEAIVQRLADAGIDIPFPTRTVRLPDSARNLTSSERDPES
ncbi:MAG: mechanosensitive ion channel family protein [Thermoplasmata archaeon]